jgi:hypothetical protein
MFKISFTVEDRHLAEILHKINKLAIELDITPLVNAIAKNGKLQQQNANSIEAFVKELKKFDTISATSAREAVQKMGGSPGAYSYYLRQATKGGLIKKHAKGRGNLMSYTWAK